MESKEQKPTSALDLFELREAYERVGRASFKFKAVKALQAADLHAAALIVSNLSVYEKEPTDAHS